MARKPKKTLAEAPAGSYQLGPSSSIESTAHLPTMANHPIVSGAMQAFTPHRPERPEKSEGGVRFEEDDSTFCGTPAVSNGQLFLRSNAFLYCIQK